jgi:hypothetical protein
MREAIRPSTNMIAKIVQNIFHRGDLMLFSVCELKKLFLVPLISAKKKTLYAGWPPIVKRKLRARIRATITLPIDAILTFLSTFPSGIYCNKSSSVTSRITGERAFFSGLWRTGRFATACDWQLLQCVRRLDPWAGIRRSSESGPGVVVGTSPVQLLCWGGWGGWVARNDSGPGFALERQMMRCL